MMSTNYIYKLLMTLECGKESYKIFLKTYKELLIIMFLGGKRNRLKKLLKLSSYSNFKMYYMNIFWDQTFHL